MCSLFKHNLLSVQKLVKDNCCHVQIYPTHCEIVDNVSHRTLARGVAKNDLYYLTPDNPDSSSLSAANVSFSNSSPSLEICHHRLGHAPLPKIQKISNQP